MAFQGFGKDSGPSARPRAQAPGVRFPRPASAPFPVPPISRPPDSMKGYRAKSVYEGYDARANQRTTAAPLIAPSDPRGSFATSYSHIQDLKRSRSPPLVYDDEFLRTSSMVRGSQWEINNQSQFKSAELAFENKQRDLFSQRPQSSQYVGPGSQGYQVNQQPKSLSPSFQNSINIRSPAFVEAQRPSFSSIVRGNEPNLPISFYNPYADGKTQIISPEMISYDFGRRVPVENVGVQPPKRNRSLLEPTNGALYGLHDAKRPSTPPPKGRSHSPSGTSDLQIKRDHPMAGLNNDVEAAATSKQVKVTVAKRTKLPSISSSDQGVQDSTFSIQNDDEKESQAKARRLARFKDDLSQRAQSEGPLRQKFPAKRQHAPMTETHSSNEESATHMGRDFAIGSTSADYEAPESSTLIVGSCPDMCPESERAERERKGDLDQYERFDGDRNQTTEFLAVKKYNRTAEREAELIRPMPILQKTMNYLLGLLDQPYDDRFLGLYNFLWDRMRAIRMDLRMQHIFNQEAIEMLEQMIRLHIIAMHELCEYTKGEGFSEGFDAHLNIEQMNKTSVELFQLYDDHRKNGMDVPTEKEFRGYYALLKLDKHPGYKVEPAELSLDLAKMTPEMRQTSEVMFARKVARACRTGNYIAFFRLAEKATFLQACLMHAHFAKLRTQALASLHSGLQNGQGIPVAHVAKWLGLEDEDVEDLLEYHGFSIKEFEELYMVKESSFLNIDSDYPVKCSKLVQQKKSRTICEDVSVSCVAELSFPEEAKAAKSDEYHGLKMKPVNFVELKDSRLGTDDEMSDFEAVPPPKDDNEKLILGAFDRNIEDQGQVSPKSLWSRVDPSFRRFSGSENTTPLSAGELKVETLPGVAGNLHFQSDSTIEPEENIVRVEKHKSLQVPESMADFVHAVPQSSNEQELQEKEEIHSHDNAEMDVVSTSSYDEEVVEARLRIILRRWNRRSSKQRELREQKQLAAQAALNSLSLGPPLWREKTQPSTLAEFDIDHVMRKRHEIQEKSWSILNVSEVVGRRLVGQNPSAKCICWKVVLCTHDHSIGRDKVHKNNEFNTGSWLRSKLLPAKTGEPDLLISSQDVSIWRKWVPNQSSSELTCCLSVIKDGSSKNLNETVVGTFGVIFLVAECVPLQYLKEQLQILLLSFPPGSRLPMLILSDSSKDHFDPSLIVNELGLSQVDESRMSSFNIICLKDKLDGQRDGFLSDEQLRVGLQWLANESPVQPVLHCIKTRELVLFHLNSLLRLSFKPHSHETSPDYFVAQFNEALDQSMRDVIAAAYSNPFCWPCPEINLLPKLSDEQRMAGWYLPSIGWSSSVRVESLSGALNDCKLPSFGNGLSWLHRGSNMGYEIENQRLEIESYLIKYLSVSSRLMGVELAKKEANLMLQKFAQLQLHDSTYYIIPKWIMIFRRVFHWSLMNLSEGEVSSTYILAQQALQIASQSMDTLHLESSELIPHYMVDPSFEDLVGVSCGPLKIALQEETEDVQNMQALSSNNHSFLERISADEMGDDGVPKAAELVTVEESYNLRESDAKLALPNGNRKEADKLTKLLERCNLVQNMIDEKLSIYF